MGDHQLTVVVLRCQPGHQVPADQLAHPDRQRHRGQAVTRGPLAGLLERQAQVQGIAAGLLEAGEHRTALWILQPTACAAEPLAQQFLAVAGGQAVQLQVLGASRDERVKCVAGPRGDHHPHAGREWLGRPVQIPGVPGGARELVHRVDEHQHQASGRGPFEATREVGDQLGVISRHLVLRIKGPPGKLPAHASHQHPHVGRTRCGPDEPG